MSFKASSDRGRPEYVLFVFWTNTLKLAFSIRRMLLSSPPIPDSVHQFLFLFLEPLHKSIYHIRLHVCNRPKSTLKLLLPSTIPKVVPFSLAIISFFHFLELCYMWKDKLYIDFSPVQ